MTTIIARNRVLVADRRKVVTFRKLGNVGIRDEPKIYATPFCLYGLSGFEFPDGTFPDQITKPEFLNRLAAIFALSYIADGDKAVDDFYKDGLKAKPHEWFGFKDRALTLRNIIGNDLARDLDQNGQGALAMGLFNSCHFNSGQFLNTSNTESLLLGSGTKFTSILLDHDYEYDELYKLIRSAGIPTGEVYDTLTVDKDLKPMVPPLSDFALIHTVITSLNNSAHWEIGKKMMDEEHARKAAASMAKSVATMFSFGYRHSKTGKWKFAKQPVFDWDDPTLSEKNMNLLNLIRRRFGLKEAYVQEKDK